MKYIEKQKLITNISAVTYLIFIIVSLIFELYIAAVVIVILGSLVIIFFRRWDRKEELKEKNKNNPTFP